MSGRFRGFKQKYKVDIENMRVKRDERKNKYLQNTRTLDISEMFTSARDLLKEKHEFLDVSCPLLNQLLGGGLRRGAITEICGASSSGKTQVCLHSTASIVLQGKPVVYLQTEGGGFPINRLEQMIQQREKMNSSFGQSSSRASTSTSSTASASSSILSSSLDRVLVQKVVNYTQLERILDTELESIIKEKGVVLVIIDSIAAILRGDSDIKDMYQRSKLIHRIGGRLKDISLNLNISILVVNQVSAAIDYHGFTGGSCSSTRLSLDELH
ncbi:DNA repair protein XRCC3 isoform X3 [Eurytemora carolleeae]|uniref:DNA repair protein XRCC3 isoform X3 n=1 Tax=Eurytemora carolleeae TaxID=1294199 RepID=UPI000C78A39B|nr:DNA repair protein XRCC3 isoform X3 [Eurytemora carolleeae]|eukprot:XP_023341370.1 DNA repair protein XRCC3-like isoform X3 [Eurytemora affinis]